MMKPFSVLWSPFFTRKRCFFCSPCLLLSTESISLDTFDKITPGIKFVRKFKKRLVILHHSLHLSEFVKTISEFITCDKMFFNNSFYITFKWCNNNFFLETIFLFLFLRIFSFLTWFLFLLVLESFASSHLDSEFLVVSYSLSLCCQRWLPCVKISLGY